MESETVKLFLESIRSDVTKNCFSIYLNKWMHFIEGSDIDEKKSSGHRIKDDRVYAGHEK